MAVVGGIFELRWLKMNKALAEPIDASKCVACDSSNWTEVGDGQFSCGDCGYDGGDGHARARATAFTQRVAGMAAPERFRAGVRSLEAARAHLLAANGTFDGALVDSRLDMIGSTDASERKNATIVSAFGEVLHAQRELGAASTYLDDQMLKELGCMDASLDFSSPAFGLDHMIEVPGAGLLAEVRIHQDIKRARERSAAMLAAAERALAKLQENSSYRGYL